MSNNELMEYFKTKGFEDLIKPNITGTLLEFFPLSEVEDAYNKILNGEKIKPPNGGSMPELNIKNLKGLEDAVKKVQERTGLDDDQMKKVIETLMGLEGAASEEPLVFSSQHKPEIVKKSSAGSWVTSYFLSILPIGDELAALLYLFVIASNKKFVKNFVEKNGVINLKKHTKYDEALTKFKASDITKLLEGLQVEGEIASFPDIKKLDYASNYATIVIIALLIAHLLYAAVYLADVETMAIMMSDSIDQIDSLASDLVEEILKEAFISFLISLAATPAAAIAIQIRKVYKAKKFADRFKKLVKIRKSMYKILESKPSKLLLKIDSHEGYIDAANLLGVDLDYRSQDVKESVNRIRKKLGIKVKKAYFNNLFITKLASFLEKNNLFEELKMLEEEIL